jgi:hypothetical protein
MDIVRLANKTTEQWRDWTKNVVSERKDLEERMDALKAEVRAPLTNYENVEKARVAAHEDALAAIGDMVLFDAEPSSAEINARLDQLADAPARNWQEFVQRAQDAREAAFERLHGKLSKALHREKQEAEEERLRAEQAERDRQEAARLQAEREARIATEAAEAARLEAERKAAAEAAAAERKAREEREAAERAAQAERHRIECEAREAANAAQRERDRIAANARASEERAAKAEVDRLAAEQRAKEAAEKAECDRIAAEKKAAEDAERREREAVEAERRRATQKAEADRLETERRSANVAHRKRINNEALAGIVAALATTDIEYSDGPDIATQIAKAIVAALAKGEIRHCTISY